MSGEHPRISMLSLFRRKELESDEGGASTTIEMAPTAGYILFMQ